jgi:hypothetical protein
MGLAPGPRIGEITRAVYEMQLDGRVGTLEEALAAAKLLLPAGELAGGPGPGPAGGKSGRGKGR